MARRHAASHIVTTSHYDTCCHGTRSFSVARRNVTASRTVSSHRYVFQRYSVTRCKVTASHDATSQRHSLQRDGVTHCYVCPFLPVFIDRKSTFYFSVEALSIPPKGDALKLFGDKNLRRNNKLVRLT